MENSLEKIADILERTHQTFIYSDLRTGNNYVIMRLQDYDSFLDKKINIPEKTQEMSDPLTDERIFDNINRDILHGTQDKNQVVDKVRSKDGYTFDSFDDESDLMISL